VRSIDPFVACSRGFDSLDLLSIGNRASRYPINHIGEVGTRLITVDEDDRPFLLYL